MTTAAVVYMDASLMRKCNVFRCLVRRGLSSTQYVNVATIMEPCCVPSIFDDN